MPDDKLFSESETIPIVQEELVVSKRPVDVENVHVRTSYDEETIVVRDTIAREKIKVRRFAMDREVDRAPAIHEADGLTIIPVVEERLVVQKRLFLVEEIHILRTQRTEAVELPTSLRRTRVEIDRTDLTNIQEDPRGHT